MSQYSGHCFCCGTSRQFVQNHRSVREGFQCPNCRASLRYRAQAEALLELFGGEGQKSLKDLATDTKLKELAVYEPGVAGPFRRHFKRWPNYVNSFYWSDVALGEYSDGVQCQNLEQLTFEDDSFDLIISSDIMEHVRRPMTAFTEIHRVLKPGASHIFSIPIKMPVPKKSRMRVDTSGEEDIHIEPAHYHGDGRGGKSLVYIDYGLDLVDQLTDSGYDVILRQPSDDHSCSQKLITFVTRKCL